MEKDLNSYISENGYAVNFYRKKKFGDHYLLTTDHGTWVMLDEQQCRDFENGVIDKELFAELYERGLLITEKNIDKITLDYVERYQNNDGAAGLHIIVPTIRCNLRCVYCHSEAESITEGKKFDMDELTLRRTLEVIFKSPQKNITIEFQGGEPLLNKEIVKLTIEYSKELNQKYKKNYMIALVSNLLALDEEFLDYLVENKDDLAICTSLDGPRELHNKNRKFVHSNIGTYDQVVEKIEMCRSKGFHIGIMMVTTKESLKYPKEIVDTFIKFDNRNIHIKPLDYLGYAKEVWSEIGYSDDEYIEFWNSCVDYMFELLNEGNVVMESKVNMSIKNLLTRENTGFLDWTNPCGLIRGQIVYNYNGDIYCCDEGRVMKESVIGNVHEEEYIDLVKKPRSIELLKAAIIEGYYCDSCVYKAFCGVCPVLHYAQEKNFNIKLNKTNRCRINKNILDYTFNKLINERKSIQKFIIGSMIDNQLGNIMR